MSFQVAHLMPLPIATISRCCTTEPLRRPNSLSISCCLVAVYGTTDSKLRFADSTMPTIICLLLRARNRSILSIVMLTMASTVCWTMAREPILSTATRWMLPLDVCRLLMLLMPRQWLTSCFRMSTMPIATLGLIRCSLWATTVTKTRI